VSRQDFKHVLVAPGVVLSEMVFDRVRFAHSTMDDFDLQREVIGLFRIQVAETKERIKLGSISAEDRKFLSHNLRGAAAAVGAVQIEELAKTWENVSFDSAVLEALLDQAESAFANESRAIYS
jgi:HPt (histidine-containing phosphotransfer) domain-containing protein